MANKASREMEEQILELKRQGKKIRKIAKSLKLSRNTVRRILREAGKAEKVKRIPLWAMKVDWEKVKKEDDSGVTLKILQNEFAPETNYHTFWQHYRKYVPQTEKVTIRLEHKPGERIFFDFTDGINIVDRMSGEKTKTQLFVGVLPFSSYTVGEFVLNQKQPTFIRAIEDAFYQVGGVTPYVTVDNLRSAVAKSHLYDPDVNQTFIEFSNHWEFAVLPARPYSPKDKAAVEGGIGVIQRQFYHEVRDRVFYSLSELNLVFKDYLKRLNDSPMKDHGDVSRNDRFKKEKDLLKPLKSDRFELCEWKTAKVHPDCHVQVEKRFYSVPYSFIGQSVRVRISNKLIEIFSSDTDPVSVHPRLTGDTRASTLDAHYPAEKVACARFEIKSALKQAEKVGPKTFELIQLLVGGEYPLRNLRRIQGILRLHQSQNVKKESLEYAASQALAFRKLSFHYVKHAAFFFEQGGNRPRVVAPIRTKEDLYLHEQN
jgi:transposase